jgi:hypothetical protein
MERWEYFFRENATDALTTEHGHSVGIEDLYRAFKERLIHELMVDVHGTSHYGRLLEKRNDG